MCPEFASGRVEKDWRARDNRQHNDRTLAARRDVRYSSDKNRNVVKSDKWDSSSHRTVHLEDHKPRCSLHNKNYCNDDTDRKPQTDQTTSSSDYRRKERISVNERSRSRSPARRKVVSGSDSYSRREARNDLHTRRHEDNFSSRGTVSEEMSSHNRLSSYTRSTRPAEPDWYVNVGTRHSTNEPESRKYKESRLSEEKMHQSKCPYTDASYFSDRKICGTRASSQLSDEQITGGCSPRRQYSSCNRQSQAYLYDDVQHSHHVSSDCKASYQGSAFSGCRCRDNNEHSHLRTDVCDQHDDRKDRHSPILSRNDLNSKPCRDRRDEDRRTCTGNRRRSSPRRRYTSTEDKTVSMRKQRSYSDGRPSASSDIHHRSENRNNDMSNNASSFEEQNSAERIPSERSMSCVHEDRFVPVTKKDTTTSDDRVPSRCSCKEELGIFQSRASQFSRTDQSVVTPATDENKNQCFAATAQADSNCLPADRKYDAVSSSSECCAVTSWSTVGGSTFLVSLAQPVIQSDQQWIGSSDCGAGGHLLRPQWPGSSVMAQHAVHTDCTRLHDLVPTAAVTQLPQLSTKMSAVPTSIDPRKLGIYGVSLASNINLSTLPSNTSYKPAAGGGSVGQYMMDSVYGDSPLLDEPSYHSPVGVNNSSLHLVGSSISSVDYMRPETIQPLDDMELKKMLDVVTVAKTTLEQTLPAGCHVDPCSQKQQKVPS